MEYPTVSLVKENSYLSDHNLLSVIALPQLNISRF